MAGAWLYVELLWPLGAPHGCMEVEGSRLLLVSQVIQVLGDDLISPCGGRTSPAELEKYHIGPVC